MMYVPISPVKNMISVMRNSQIASLPFGNGMPMCVLGCGAWLVCSATACAIVVSGQLSVVSCQWSKPTDGIPWELQSGAPIKHQQRQKRRQVDQGRVEDAARLRARAEAGKRQRAHEEGNPERHGTDGVHPARLPVQHRKQADRNQCHAVKCHLPAG